MLDILQINFLKFVKTHLLLKEFHNLHLEAVFMGFWFSNISNKPDLPINKNPV